MKKRTPKGAAQKFLRDVVFTYEGNDCLIWPFSHNGHGYAKTGPKGSRRYIHRIACEVENGPAPTPKHEAAHSCGNGKHGCVARRHLEWKTHAENQADRLGHGTHNRGERCGAALLSQDEALRILDLKGDMPQTAIAEMFGISRTTVSSIHTRRNWGWLEDAA